MSWMPVRLHSHGRGLKESSVLNWETTMIGGLSAANSSRMNLTHSTAHYRPVSPSEWASSSAGILWKEGW